MHWPCLCAPFQAGMVPGTGLSIGAGVVQKNLFLYLCIRERFLSISTMAGRQNAAHSLAFSENRRKVCEVFKLEMQRSSDVHPEDKNGKLWCFPVHKWAVAVGVFEILIALIWLSIAVYVLANAVGDTTSVKAAAGFAIAFSILFAISDCLMLYGIRKRMRSPLLVHLGLQVALITGMEASSLRSFRKSRSRR